MNFFKKIFNPARAGKPPQKIEIEPENVQNKALDDLFVEKFIAKGGRFLYCQTTKEINTHLLNILEQEQWRKPMTFAVNLKKLMQNIGVKTNEEIDESDCFFTHCEHLIAEDGSILFSSNQIKENKLATLSINFIVFAKTSQLVKSKGDSLTGIKNRYKKQNLPSNIAAIKCFNPLNQPDDFMSYGINNAKQLYLLLLEDL